MTLTETPPSSNQFEYSSAGADETGLANGLNTLTFSITDSTDTVTFKRDMWNFYTDNSDHGVPRPTAPINGVSVPGGVPTYTFSIPSSTRNAADILVLLVEDAVTGDDVFFTVLPPSATSFNHPFDTPLPTGSYGILVGAANFASGTHRGEFFGLVAGVTGFTPDFTVPSPVSSTAGATTQVPAAAPAAPTLQAWK